ncbi:ankyrin repeat-containing domain protein [Mycena pura]|uniref:Ankyrin repeat-containing domain protein n=1 Tax=Mycena pura TaxID=153505 RepID=A0AAD6VMM9_9AGAR|nr:ankyrin repeat-containing domain protein [Mycena pura]
MCTTSSLNSPELVWLLPPSMSSASLNALASTCRRLHSILQPALEARLTPDLAPGLLIWATASIKAHIVKKLLSPPHSVNPNKGNDWIGGYLWFSKSPLHVAAKSRSIEIASLLLKADASPMAVHLPSDCQPLHFAALNRDLQMMELLLDFGAPIDSTFGCDGRRESALHYACFAGKKQMVQLLLDRGASLEPRGHYGTALGFAVHKRRLDVVQMLLEKGADATVTAPLFVLLDGGPPQPLQPHNASLLYIALSLRPPRRPYEGWRQTDKWAAPQPKWGRQPLGERQCRLMAMLLAHGARKEDAMDTIKEHLRALAKEAQCTEDEFLEIVGQMFKEAEDAVSELSFGPQ